MYKIRKTKLLSKNNCLERSKVLDDNRAESAEVVRKSKLLLSATIGKLPNKDIRDYTDRDLDRLYEEWEENDEDQLEEDELPLHKQKPKTPSLDEALKKANSPEDLLKLTKKGQSVMMFVNVGDVDGKPATKEYTEKWTNNRVIYMFMDGSKAWEAKDFLLQQQQVSEVTLEGKQYDGPAKKVTAKTEL
ncbi:unnamed protein product [Enterobius vermicularis]|uniref:Mesoderm development candidate 2 n=1 Tax=Enterobius vermicularis TaxID=51028 RepID=A0A0N4VB90_ENTVE|nr:unnamed protein product [Enterobius vermicularis]